MTSGRPAPAVEQFLVQRHDGAVDGGSDVREHCERDEEVPASPRHRALLVSSMPPRVSA